MAACPHKRENGSPISSTKLGQRIARLLLFASAGGGKDQAPAGSYKLARSIFTPVAGLPFHETTLWFSLTYTSNKRSIHRAAAVACLRPSAKSAVRENSIKFSFVRDSVRRCAGGGARTHTILRSLDFESSASANSATPASREIETTNSRAKLKRF